MAPGREVRMAALIAGRAGGLLSRRRALLALGGLLGGACESLTTRPVTAPVTPSVTSTVTSTVTPRVTVAVTPTSVTPPVTADVTPRPTVAPVAAVATPTAPRGRAVLPGIDVLVRDRRADLAGRALGLVTNATGRDRAGRSTIDVLHADTTWRLVALFSPEHGIRGDAEAGASVDSAVDRDTGLPIYSLYGETTRPSPAMLRGIDTLVYDIQDAGTRTYTYIATLLEVMRAGAAQGISVVVLDRPNPIGGEQVEGNVLDPRFASFVGPAPLAMRYGLTIGELAGWFNAELRVGADLTVVPLAGWTREMWFDATGLGWVNPSPNLRSLSAAALYPGTVLVEGTSLSEGRGTERPFEWLGAPWIDAAAWVAALDRAAPPGVRFQAASRTPSSSKFADQPCQGVLIEIEQRRALQPMALGVELLAAARDVAGARLTFTADQFDRLAGTDRVRIALQAGRPAGEIGAAWQADLQRFTAARRPYLLY